MAEEKSKEWEARRKGGAARNHLLDTTPANPEASQAIMRVTHHLNRLFVEDVRASRVRIEAYALTSNGSTAEMHLARPGL